MDSPTHIDTEALLSSVDIVALVSERVTLRRAGKEFTGLCPFHDDKTAGSFTVSPQKQFYHCFACGAHGDAIDWRMFTDGVAFNEACRRLGSGLAGTPGDKREPRIVVPERITAAPPRGQVMPDPVSRWGEPAARYVYRSAHGDPLGMVVRYDYVEDGKVKKITPQWTWGSIDGGKTWSWAMGHWNKPRPLYGLDLLAAAPDRAVMIVEGEKCADAARQLLPSYVTVTWPGGANAVDYADWSVLANRKVVIWPDADAAGWKAAERLEATLRPIASRVRVLDTTGMPEKWDVADALVDGWTTERTVEWARGVVRNSLTVDDAASHPAQPTDTTVQEPTAPSPPTPAAKPIKKTRTRGPLVMVTGGAEPAAAAPATEAVDGFMTWEALGLKVNGKGIPFTNLDNCVRVLEHHREMAGRFWFDEFHQKVFTSLSGAPREVTDADVLAVTRWMQRTVGLSHSSDELIAKALRHTAIGNLRSEPRDWMDSLTWDGTPRIFRLLSDYFGAVHGPYIAAVGRNFMRALAARVYRPGCKVDNMMILEGPQGSFKSTALSILGGSWYAEAHESVTSKDFFLTLQGKLLVEIGEMDSFSRAETTKVKQVISCQVDRYRAPYARLVQDYPRRNVFVGTTNDDAYLRDATGARRFWPVRCDRINLDALARDRDQLFAEAVAEFKVGDSWWVMPGAETNEAQEARRNRDEWEMLIRRWVDQVQVQDGPDSPWRWVDRERPMMEVQMSDLLQHALDIPPGKWNRADQMRVADCLKAMGWVRRKKTNAGWFYHRPA